MIDMPISLVTDTLILPYDLIMKEPPIDISITDSFGEKVPDAEISVREINGRKSEGLTNQSGVYVFSGNHKLIDSITLTKDG